MAHLGEDMASVTHRLRDKVTFVQPFPCTGKAFDCRTKDATGAALVMDQRHCEDVGHARSRSGGPKLYSDGLGGLFLLSHNPKRILWADQMHILVSFIIIILLLPSVSEIYQQGRPCSHQPFPAITNIFPITKDSGARQTEESSKKIKAICGGTRVAEVSPLGQNQGEGADLRRLWGHLLCCSCVFLSHPSML